MRLLAGCSAEFDRFARTPQVIEQGTETFYRRPLFVRAMEEEEAPRRWSHFVGQQNCSTQGYNWHQR